MNNKPIQLKQLIEQLQKLSEQLGEETPVMVRRTGYTADYLRQAISATAVERFDGKSEPPIGRFYVHQADDISNFEDMGVPIILLS